MDETASVESSKSGHLSKFKVALNELDVLKRQNELLELKIKELNGGEAVATSSNDDSEVNKNNVWVEVQVFMLIGFGC